MLLLPEHYQQHYYIPVWMSTWFLWSYSARRLGRQSVSQHTRHWNSTWFKVGKRSKITMHFHLVWLVLKCDYMWLRGRSGGLWLGRDPGGVGGSVKIGDWVFDLVGVFPWLRSFGLTFRLLVLREYSYLGVFLSAVTIWSMPFVLVSCC